MQKADRDLLNEIRIKAEQGTKPDQFDIEFVFMCHRGPDLTSAAIATLALAALLRKDFVSYQEAFAQMERVVRDVNSRRMYIHMSSVVDEMALKASGSDAVSLEDRTLLRSLATSDGQLSAEERRIADSRIALNDEASSFPVGLALLCKSGLRADDLSTARGWIASAKKSAKSQMAKDYWAMVSRLVAHRNPESAK